MKIISIVRSNVPTYLSVITHMFRIETSLTKKRHAPPAISFARSRSRHPAHLPYHSTPWYGCHIVNPVISRVAWVLQLPYNNHSLRNCHRCLYPWHHLLLALYIVRVPSFNNQGETRTFSKETRSGRTCIHCVVKEGSAVRSFDIRFVR